jgi:carboxylesterase type B
LATLRGCDTVYKVYTPLLFFYFLLAQKVAKTDAASERRAEFTRAMPSCEEELRNELTNERAASQVYLSLSERRGRKPKANIAGAEAARGLCPARTKKAVGQHRRSQRPLMCSKAKMTRLTFEPTLRSEGRAELVRALPSREEELRNEAGAEGACSLCPARTKKAVGQHQRAKRSQIDAGAVFYKTSRFLATFSRAIS